MSSESEFTVENIYELFDFHDLKSFHAFLKENTPIPFETVELSNEVPKSYQFATKTKDFQNHAVWYAETIQFQRFLNRDAWISDHFLLPKCATMIVGFSHDGDLFVQSQFRGHYKAGERYAIPQWCFYRDVTFKVDNEMGTDDKPYAIYQRWTSYPSEGDYDKVFWWTDSKGDIPYFVSNGEIFTPFYDEGRMKRLFPRG